MKYLYLFLFRIVRCLIRYPSKICEYKDSSISKFPILLEVLKENDYSIHDLFSEVKGSIKSITEYIEILDCLYALGKLEFNKDTRRIHYVI